MSKNITFGTGGTEVARISTNGLTLNTGTLPETTGTLTWTHSTATGTFTTSYTYVTTGNLCILTVGSYLAGMSFGSAGILQTTLPAAIRPQGSKGVICYSAVLTIGVLRHSYGQTSCSQVKWRSMVAFNRVGI
jgi:hypothetical protein